MSTEKFFTWYDSWVIASILRSIENEALIDLSSIIANGDMLNHAIFTTDELKSGFYKSQKKRLILIENNKIILLEKGHEIKEKALKRRGGLFKIIDNFHHVLNSKRTKYTDVSDEDIDLCFFINDESI